MVQGVGAGHHRALEEAEHEHADHDERDRVLDPLTADLQQEPEDQHVDRGVDDRGDQRPQLAEIGALVLGVRLRDREHVDEGAARPEILDVGDQPRPHPDRL